MATHDKFGILFVCTGNICRSPTADAIARAWVAQHGLEGHFEIDSAGIAGYHVGEAPDARSQEAAARHGYDLSALRARQIEVHDYQHFDLLLAMDDGHLKHMRRMAPPVYRPKVRLFLSYTKLPAFQQEVGDPYYGGPQGFEEVIALCEEGVQALFAHLLDGGAMRARG